MRMVVLDGQTLNPGDLSWSGLESLGDCQVYERTPPDQIEQRAQRADILLTNKTVLGGPTLERLPQLRYIGVLATGYNVVDVQAARRRGICVTNVPSYGTPSVAQMVFAHLLNLTQRVADHAETVRQGRWSQSIDWCYWDYPLIELAGLTIGIVGFGRIGQAVAGLATAFGMRVLFFDPASSAHLPEGAESVELDVLFGASDVISLHCPLTPQTEGLVNRERLALMKPTALLINTSRGLLVDEQALAEALNAGRLAGAGLDVLAIEPPERTNPLLHARNCFVTPHIAWATRAARARLLQVAIDNVKAFLAGEPTNVVSR